MRALVTGATGFTGGHLARGLVAGGDRVRAFVRDPQRARDLSASGIEIAVGSLEVPASIDQALKDIDVVYHVAAIYRSAGVGAAEYRTVNAEAVGTLVEMAAVRGVKRVVLCSTVGVHGHVEHPPANEDAPLRPGDVYQESKLEGERLAQSAAARCRIELTIARPSGIYGPGDRRFLKLFRGVAHRRWAMLGRGTVYYHVTYIDDLVEGLWLCGTVPAAAGRTYILAGNEAPRLNELVELVAEAVGLPRPWLRLPVWPVWMLGAVCEAVCVPLRIEPPLYRRRVDFFTKSRWFDIARAKRELGYQPRVDLREGIRRTVAWYRQEGWL